MSDDKTIAIYDAQVSAYADKTDKINAEDPRLATFVAACPPGGAVLDLGCGPGASAAIMAQAGLHVTAWDASAEMVAQAATHPGVTARQAVFDDLTDQTVYDGIWANFSLLHAPRADFPRHLAAIHRALRPGGVLMIGMKLGTGEARDGLGRFYTYYTQEALMTHLTQAGFTIIDHKLGSGTGLDGSVSDFISVHAHG